MEGGVMEKRRWTPAELEQLAILFSQHNSDEKIASILNRTTLSVKIKRRQLRLFYPDAVDIAIENSHRYTDEECDFIRYYYQKKSDTWMAKKLRVSIHSYKHQRARMNLKKMDQQKKGLRRSWHFKEEQFLIDHYKDASYKDIAKILKRKENTVAYKAYRLGLRKPNNVGRRGFEPLNIGNYTSEEGI